MEALAAVPGAQEGLLGQVFRVLVRAEHAVARAELVPVTVH